MEQDDFLICTNCKDDSLLESSTLLTCNKCGTDFPISEGIPVMLRQCDLDKSTKAVAEVLYY